MARAYIPVKLRELVINRAQGYCEYCRFPVRFALESMEFDHVFPLSLGGKTTAINLALACHHCNQHKRNQIVGFDRTSGSEVPLYNPRTMKWADHFAWSEDTTLIVGKTAIGRGTLAVLKLNRLGVVNLRRVLQVSGDHPPD
jgi:hypothetical protein